MYGIKPRSLRKKALIEVSKYMKYGNISYVHDLWLETSKVCGSYRNGMVTLLTISGIAAALVKAQYLL